MYLASTFSCFGKTIHLWSQDPEISIIITVSRAASRAQRPNSNIHPPSPPPKNLSTQNKTICQRKTISQTNPMTSNNPPDVSGAVHSAESQVTPLVETALSGASQQNDTRAESDFSGISAGPASLPVSSVEAELLSAHAAGAMFSNGLGGSDPVSTTSVPKVEDYAQAASDHVFQQDAAYRETVLKTAGSQDNGVYNNLKAEEGTMDNRDNVHNKDNVNTNGTDEAEVSAEDAGFSGESKEATARRNQNKRPRKNVDFLSGGYFSDELSEEEIEADDDEEDDEYDPDAEDEPQKKRGRPKSTVTEYTATGEPKRKRGRPRKYPIDAPPANPSDADGEPKVKRKRGRPRKIRPEELQEGVDGVPVAASAIAVAAAAVDEKPGNEGNQEVDLGPIIMSNLNEANIDPNLDPSLYSNADASVYSPVGTSLRHVSISLSPVSTVKAQNEDSSVVSDPDSVESTSPTQSPERRSGQLMEESPTEKMATLPSEMVRSVEAIRDLQKPENNVEAATPVKRKRGRPRKGEEIRSWAVAEEELRRSDRRAVTQRRNMDEQKRARKALREQERQEREERKLLRKLKQKERLEKTSADAGSASESNRSGGDNVSLLDDSQDSNSSGSDSDSDSEELSDDSDIQEYKIRKSPQKHRVSKIRKTPVSKTKVPMKPREPREPNEAKEPKEPKEPKTPKERKTPIQRRSKKGRPSKQENVTKKITSIFKTEDGDISLDIPEEIARPDKLEKKLPVLNSKVAAVALNFDNKGQSSFSDIPIVSGIKNPKQAEPKTEVEDAVKFVPLPVPEVDADGQLKDPSYIEKYLPGVIIHNNEEGSGRLIDERAFFLEGSEGFFEQHNLRFRPSASSLALNAPTLGFEEFAPFIELELLVHRKERDALTQMHKSLYHQWCFELSQGYSLNFFGVGSKTKIIMDFLEEYFVSWYHEVICEGEEPVPPIMVVNGYNPGTKLKTVLHDMTSAVVATSFATTIDADDAKFQPRMPKHVSETFPFLLGQLKRQEARHQKNRVHKASLVLVIHNLDGDAFRDQRSQNLLSQLALLPNVWVIVSTDNVNLGLLWDLYRFKNFNFLWHNVTSYEPYTVEMSFKDVLSMGQSKKFIGSRGAKYVLASLTANAQKLYEVLLQLQMETLTAATTTKAGRTGLKGSSKNSVELRAVYDKCVEKFIVSNEVNFKTMLHEYVEHKMCVVAKNSAGQEVVYVPFALDEMAKLKNEEFGGS